MIYHVLPGDAQAGEFDKTGIRGSLIIFREALITGPIDDTSVDEFWERRSSFLLSEYGEDTIDYQEKVADEILRLEEIGDSDEVNLWFEFELFCGVNYWFCLDQLKNSAAPIYRVAPIFASPDNVWDGFAQHTADDLKDCYDSRTRLTDEDVAMGSELWKAFRDRDRRALRTLGDYRSPAFPFLKEVCEAAADIDLRPVEVIREIIAAGKENIEDAFPAFRERAGVYGFGDLQVEKLIERFG